MDSLITAAARALAAGDLLGALKRVGLRDDAPRSRCVASRWRSSAISRARRPSCKRDARLRSERGRGPREVRGRRGRDRACLARPRLADEALDAARMTLEEHGDWVNAAHARHLEVRRLLLIGRLDEAERALAGLDPAPFPPASRAAYELAVAGIAMRRLRTKVARAALARAERAARQAGIPALTAEVESASHVLTTPAARLIAGGEARLLRLEEVEAVLESGALIVDACRHVVRTQTRWSRSRGVRCCSRSHERSARRGPETCRGTRSSSAHSVPSTPMNRIARACGWRSGGCAPSFGRSPA